MMADKCVPYLYLHYHTVHRDRVTITVLRGIQCTQAYIRQHTELLGWVLGWVMIDKLLYYIVYASGPCRGLLSCRGSDSKKATWNKFF